MNDVIEDVIRKKPHLTDPFRFYEKMLRFLKSAKESSFTMTPGQNAYAPEDINKVMDLFSSFIDLPEGALSPLKQALEVREIDFTRLPLGETPAFSLPYGEDDLTMLLYLLSKPWFIALRDAGGPGEQVFWEESKCPVCKGRPSIAWIEEDRRKVSCSFCGTTGFVNRTGCPVCLVDDGQKQDVVMFAGEEGFAINTCDLCHSYVKTIDVGLVRTYSAEIADLMSLPIDIIAQEKGHMRRSPNPIGMRKITTQG